MRRSAAWVRAAATSSEAATSAAIASRPSMDPLPLSGPTQPRATSDRTESFGQVKLPADQSCSAWRLKVSPLLGRPDGKNRGGRGGRSGIDVAQPARRHAGDEDAAQFVRPRLRQADLGRAEIAGVARMD